MTETGAVESALRTQENEPEQPGWLRELLDEAPSPARAARQADAEAVAAPVRRPTRATPTTATPSPDRPPRRVTVADHSGSPSTPEVASAPDPNSRVAVMLFEDITLSDRDMELVTDLARSITTGLESVGTITIVPAAADARLVVGGGVQRLGDSVRVTARVVDQRDGDVISAVKVDGTVSELPQVGARVAAAIRDSLLETIDTGGTVAGVPRAAVAAIMIRPFVNVSAGPEDAEFGDAILGALQDVSLVAAEPDAEWIVNGAIQRVGNVVRVTANLIDVTEGSMVSAIKIDGVASDLGSVRDDVATAVRDSVVEALDTGGAGGAPVAAVEAPPAGITVRPFSNVSQMQRMLRSPRRSAAL